MGSQVEWVQPLKLSLITPTEILWLHYCALRGKVTKFKIRVANTCPGNKRSGVKVSAIIALT